jgi:hypothetical protein
MRHNWHVTYENGREHTFQAVDVMDVITQSDAYWINNQKFAGQIVVIKRGDHVWY